nr:MAG TPA: hypothetical protein [Caudoviricetes sp.]DAS10719.1 MAG TPA: hypothetical protein [Caudoviricetes sp.]DAZ63298.1 MAG TPA: hypothetical protein [Caudoviricetes sp.]
MACLRFFSATPFHFLHLCMRSGSLLSPQM